MITVIIVIIVVIPMLLFLVWQYLQEARVQIESGHVGLLIARGKAKEEALTPGVHYVWPFRRHMIQDYSLREVSYFASDDESADGPALVTDVGGRTEARVSFVLRYRIDPDHLHRVHEYIGPNGIQDLARDYAGQTIVEYLSNAQVELPDLYGSKRRELERLVGEHLTTRLAERGIIVAMFGIRDVDLGLLGQVLQDTRRARLELERESARAEVRRARIANEITQAQALGDTLDDTALRYLQIEAWREYVDRWDGRGQLPLVFPGVGDQAPRPSASTRSARSARDANDSPATEAPDDGDPSVTVEADTPS